MTGQKTNQQLLDELLDIRRRLGGLFPIGRQLDERGQEASALLHVLQRLLQTRRAKRHQRFPKVNKEQSIQGESSYSCEGCWSGRGPAGRQGPHPVWNGGAGLHSGGGAQRLARGGDGSSQHDGVLNQSSKSPVSLVGNLVSLVEEDFGRFTI